MIRVGLALSLTIVVACADKSSEADRTTPAGAIRAFFAALESGDIPEDLDRYMVDPLELETWRARCESRGCTGGTIRAMTVAEQRQFRATVRLDYIVRSTGGGTLMRGADSPISLVREGRNWYVLQWGERHTFRVDQSAGEAADAGAPPPP